MKRKILIVTSWYPSDRSPLNGIFVQEQAQILSRIYDVAVLVPELVGWRELFRGDEGSKSRTQNQAGLLVKQVRTQIPVPLSPLAHFGYLRAAGKGLRSLLMDWGKPDLIHAHVVLPAGWAAVNLGRQHHIPMILTEHSGPFSMHLSNFYKRMLVRKTLTEADSIIAVSPALAGQILSFHRQVEVNVIGNLVRSEFFVPPTRGAGLSNRTKRFLCIALLSEQKGLDYLLKASQILSQRGFKSFEIIIGGDGSARAKLEQMAKLLGIEQYCRFLGMLDRNEVKRWMQHCDVFVLPSLHETFGIVLAEAMACGKPVIATRCGGPEFVVTEETGILVDVANPLALADAMTAFMENRLMFDSEAVRESVVRRFGEKAFLANISEQYERVWMKS